MDAQPGVIVDHANHNTLDNRRSNLRICTYQENNMNAQKRQNTSSQYKGVRWNQKNRRWYAGIKFNKKDIHLGTFKDEIEAARAYNASALMLFGPFAVLNPV